MDPVHLHLMLNHAPVLLLPLGSFLLLVALAVRHAELRTLSLIFVVVGALLAIPVFLTGEPAEDRVEGLPGVTGAVVHRHEEAAEVALVLTLAAGAAALGGWILARRRAPAVVALLLGLAASAALARAAFYGGQVRHTELRAGSPPAPSGKHAGHDDD